MDFETLDKDNLFWRKKRTLLLCNKDKHIVRIITSKYGGWRNVEHLIADLRKAMNQEKLYTLRSLYLKTFSTK